MTTVYRVWRCTRCGGRRYHSRGSGSHEPDEAEAGLLWCTDCAAIRWHTYEGIETA